MANEITDLARRYRTQINLGTTAAPDWQTVLGVVDFKPAVDPVIQKDSDYESGGWRGNTKTAQGWMVELKISHKYDPDTLLYHPTHTALKDASEAFGTGSRVEIRYFDRDGKPDARQGTAVVTWKPDGGDDEQLDRVTVTLTGDGQLTSITNPLNTSPVPIISSVSPASGSAAGGELVTITGAYFTGATDVDFGATPATEFIVISDTKISAITPAVGAGTVDVSVTTPNGSNANTAADDYTYA